MRISMRLFLMLKERQVTRRKQKMLQSEKNGLKTRRDESIEAGEFFIHFYDVFYQIILLYMVNNMNNKYKRSSRSRSRSKSSHHRKNRSKERDKSRERSKNKQSNRDKFDKNKSRKHSSSSSPSRSSSSSQSNKSEQSFKNNERKEESQNQEPRYKIQQTKTLKIQNCIHMEAAERALTDASISAGTSVPDQVQLKQGAIYAKYPSIEVSCAVKQKLKDTITINGHEYRVNFYPFKRIDLNAAYDWYCDKCEYKNFARRNKCYRCDNEKNQNCKLNFSSASAPPPKISKEDNINNCSLMVRGPIIMSTQQQILLDLFQSICSVKDIRMIKNKMTGQMKDFAFIQFFTPEDAALALKHATSPEFKVKGEKVSVMYSRNKSDDDYSKPLPYEKKQRHKDFSKKQKRGDQVIQNYYNRQRQLQIEQQKQRPLITIEQLKQKHQQQLRKKAANARELTEQQVKRRQAQLMAKQMQKQAKMQNTVLYICVPCRRKFKGEAQMKAHEQNSEYHRFHKQKLQLSL